QNLFVPSIILAARQMLAGPHVGAYFYCGEKKFERREIRGPRRQDAKELTSLFLASWRLGVRSSLLHGGEYPDVFEQMRERRRELFEVAFVQAFVRRVGVGEGVFDSQQQGGRAAEKFCQWADETDAAAAAYEHGRLAEAGF